VRKLAVEAADEIHSQRRVDRLHSARCERRRISGGIRTQQTGFVGCRYVRRRAPSGRRSALRRTRLLRFAKAIPCIGCDSSNWRRIGKPQLVDDVSMMLDEGEDEQRRQCAQNKAQVSFIVANPISIIANGSPADLRPLTSAGKNSEPSLRGNH
jgi:hypothetical protein